MELERSPRAGARSAGRRRSLELNDRAAKFYEYVLWSLPAGAPGRRLLAERGVEDALARRFRVGFAPGGAAGNALVRYLVGKGGAALPEIVDAGLAGRGGRDLFRNRLVFPIADDRGQVLGFGARALGDDKPKYLNTPETGVYHKSMALFGLDQARPALRERRVAVVVEGYFDVLAAHTAGVDAVVASSGTALTREQVRILARHADQVVLCFDGDEAGRRAADAAVDLCAAEKLKARIAVMPPPFKDPDEMVRTDPAGFAAIVGGAEPEWHVLLRWRTAGVGVGVDERRRAAESVAALLRRIPDEGTRELYAGEGAQMLEVRASSLVASALTQERAAGLTRTRPPAGAPPPSATPTEAAAPGFDEGDAGHPPPSWEEFLATYAVQRPDLARVMVDEMGLDPDDLESPAVRHILEAAAAVPNGADALPARPRPFDSRMAARLTCRDLPGAGPPRPRRPRARHGRLCREGPAGRASAVAPAATPDALLAVPGDLDPERDERVAARLRELHAEERRPPG